MSGEWGGLCWVSCGGLLYIQGKGACKDRPEEMAEASIGLTGPPVGCGLRPASTDGFACDIPGTVCVAVLVGSEQERIGTVQVVLLHLIVREANNET